MDKEEMESIRMSMVGQDQHLAEALECCRQIRMEAERMEKAYSAARESIRGILSMEPPGETKPEEMNEPNIIYKSQCPSLIPPWYFCMKCNKRLGMDNVYCPGCGEKKNWENIKEDGEE